MATFDDAKQILDITIGVLSTGTEAVDVLTHLGEGVGYDREIIEAFPVVDFAFPAHVRVQGRTLRIHLSALDQDVQWCDGAIAVLTADPDSDALLDHFGFGVIEEEALRQMSPDELLSGAGGPSPVVAVLVTPSRTEPVDLADEDLVRVDGDVGDRACVKSLVQTVLQKVVGRIQEGEREPLPLPTNIHMGFHHPEEDGSALQAVGMPRPKARVNLFLRLRESFETADGKREFRVPLVGSVHELHGLNTVVAKVKTVGEAPDELQGAWYARLDREQSFENPWLLRALSRTPIAELS